MAEKFKYKIRKNRAGNTVETVFERLDADSPVIPALYSEGEEDRHGRFKEGRTYQVSPETINEAIQEEVAEEQTEALQAEAKATKKSGRKAQKR